MELHKRITESQLVFENEQNEALAILEFAVEEDTLVVMRTNVDVSLRGQGMAARLMEEFCQYAKLENKKIRPVCSYAMDWLEKNPEIN